MANDNTASQALWALCSKLAEQALAEEQREARRPNEPEALDGRSPIIRFDKRFHSGTKVYEYAAIGIFGHWYLTGQNRDRFTWSELMEWIGEENWDSVRVLHGVREAKPEEVGDIPLGEGF